MKDNKDTITKDDIMGPKPAWYATLNGIQYAQQKMGIYDLDYATMSPIGELKCNRKIDDKGDAEII